MKRLLIAIVVLGCLPGIPYAHRMDLDCYAEGNQLVVEAWTGRDDPAAQGDVTIASQDGSILIQGKTDDEGFFRWKPKTIQAIKVTVYAGEGHKKSLDISKEDLSALFADTHIDNPELENTAANTETSRVSGATPSRRSGSLSTQNAFGTPERVVIGLTFLCAFAAFWIAYRNSKKLDEILRTHKNS